MNNHIVRLEESFGNLTWMLPDMYSNALYKFPEDAQRKYLAEYTKVLNKTLHYIAACMQLPPKMQEKYLTALMIVIQELAEEGIREVTILKEKEGK